MFVFGPIPSRRLGKSLGINNIPAKVCPYSCVYCQLGNTTKMSVERSFFYFPDKIFLEVERKVEEAKKRDERIDYLTFVSDGEPTLDNNLGKEIDLLKQFNLPIAILTNSSLLWQEDVREDLLKADFVSLKIDAVSKELWRVVNRPHESLKIEKVLEGIRQFSEEFNGTMATETMFIDSVSYKDEFDKFANFLKSIKPDKVYIAVPTRPPAEIWVKPPKEAVINEAYQTFASKLNQEKIEYLIGYEGNAFAFTGNIKENLLSIVSVHPMREEGVKELLKKANADWSIVDKLRDQGTLIELEYENHTYFMRKLPSRIKQ